MFGTIALGLIIVWGAAGVWLIAGSALRGAGRR